MFARRLLAVLVAGWVASVSSAAIAVTSATFVISYADVGDLGDGPGFDVTGVDPIDDGGGCDSVVMVMVDATGTVTDVDTICLTLPAGTSGSDGDYGSFGTGYLPVTGPVTYALYDLSAADLVALTGLGDTDQAYFDYIVANSTFLAEATVPVEGIPNGAPFSFAGAGAAGAPTQCYSAKDLKNPAFTPVPSLAVADAFGSSTIAVKKPAYVCAQSGVGGDPAPMTDASVCCYKMKGLTLSPAAEVQTTDDLGTLQLRLATPKLFCTPCTRGPLP